MFHVFTFYLYHPPMLPLAIPSLHDLDLHLTGWANGLQWPLEPLIRLTLAAVLGGLVGLEREVRGRQAGFRTNILVALGCCLAMVVSISFAYHPWPRPGMFNINVDPARLAYNVMAGIGFLGAGIIVKNGGSVRGLTTAAALWCVAAIGLACGFGLYLIAVFSALIILLVLWILDHFERFLPKVRYRVVTLRRTWHPRVVGETVKMIETHEHLDVRDASFRRVDDLSWIEIRLTIAFSSKRRYFEFERSLDENKDCQLLAASSET
jgi:putative Mg2+ transporter-C (MgtC) family protein